MKIDTGKVRSAQAEARARKAENRDEHQNTEDLAYKLTLDNSWHFYEGMLAAYTAIFDGRFNEDDRDTELSGDSKPAPRNSGTGKGRKVGVPSGRRKAR